jgi:hypothetical protein
MLNWRFAIYNKLGADPMSTRQEVYEAAGRALEVSQMLEMELGTALLALDAMETNSFLAPNPDTYQRLRQEIDGLTLGKALKRIGKKLNIAEDLEVAFADALKARNFVAHHLFKRNSLAMLDEETRMELLEEARNAFQVIHPAYSLAQDIAVDLTHQVLHVANQARI